MNEIGRRARLGLGIALVTLVGGCLAVRSPEVGAPVRVASGEGAVFGRVRVYERGIEITPWKREVAEILAEDPDIQLALFHIDSGRKRPNLPLSAEGRFEWILPAGAYLLYHTPSVAPPSNEPFAAFRVSEGSEPVDLGEILLSVSVDRSFDETLANYSLIDVAARPPEEEGGAAFLRHHPGTSQVRPGSFVVDPELRVLFLDYSRERCERILARHGASAAIPGPP